jgi:hypothetical protein
MRRSTEDRETRAEPINRDRHDGLRSCQGVWRGGIFAQVSDCDGNTGMLDDETTCRW